VRATAILTGVLVAVTAYYAWQNRQMVREMAASREVAILPKLVLDFAMLGPTVGAVKVSNVGPGPALDVDISISFEPVDVEKHETIIRRWTTSVMASGESREFLPTKPGGTAEALHMPELASTYAAVRLSGHLLDAVGRPHQAEDVIDDIATWRHLVSESLVRWRHPDPERRNADAMAEQLDHKFGRRLQDITSELAEIRSVLASQSRSGTEAE
jgi:hypothetical protein